MTKTEEREVPQLIARLRGIAKDLEDVDYPSGASGCDTIEEAADLIESLYTPPVRTTPAKLCASDCPAGCCACGKNPHASINSKTGRCTRCGNLVAAFQDSPGEQEPTMALRVLERLASVADCGTVQEIVEALRDACVNFLTAKTEYDSDLWWTTLRAHAYILREDWDGAGNPVPAVPQETDHD